MTLCRVLLVSKSGYYSWASRPVSQRIKSNIKLLGQIQNTYLENKKAYGSPRIHVALKRKGIFCGHNRIAHLMRENSIVAQRQFRRKNHGARHGRSFASNLVNRSFNVSSPNHIWASDITVLWSGSGWLYLAITMDLYSRRIIGWAMQRRATEDLTINALKMALGQRTINKDMIHHSDQGSQYSSESFKKELEKHHIRPSMSSKGNCYDNAVVESFFKSLKAEIQKEDRSKNIRTNQIQHIRIHRGLLQQKETSFNTGLPKSG